MYYDSQTQNNLMQRFGDQKQKDFMNVDLYVASTRFTQPTFERRRELYLKDKDSSLLHMIEPDDTIVVIQTNQLKDP